MSEFKLKCPKNYPLQCNLLDSDKETLKRSEKYKGFLMYQFEDRQQDDYAIETIKSYFRPPSYYLYDAGVEPGLVIKTCKICRLALASDFGVAVLTPLNNNVFFESGIELGLGKPVVYIVDEDICKAKDLPFDLTDKIVITHTLKQELKSKLENEIPPFIEKVILSTEFERHLRAFINNKINKLKLSRQLLEYFVLEKAWVKEKWITDVLQGCSHGTRAQQLSELYELGFIQETKSMGGCHHNYSWWSLVEQYRPYLEEILFK